MTDELPNDRPRTSDFPNIFDVECLLRRKIEPRFYANIRAAISRDVEGMSAKRASSHYIVEHFFKYKDGFYSSIERRLDTPDKEMQERLAAVRVEMELLLKTHVEISDEPRPTRPATPGPVTENLLWLVTCLTPVERTDDLLATYTDQYVAQVQRFGRRRAGVWLAWMVICGACVGLRNFARGLLPDFGLGRAGKD